MSLLKSIYTLLGNNYKANEYNRELDSAENGGGYYIFDTSNTDRRFVLDHSLTNSAGHDEKMPPAYVLDADLLNGEFVPPLVQTAYTHLPISKVTSLEKGAPNTQTITTLPVPMSDTKIKGILQFRSSPRGVSDQEPFKEYRLSLARYVANNLGPLFTPKQAATHGPTFKTLNTPEGLAKFLSGMRDIWKDGIKEWSHETYMHTQNVTELCERVADKINAAEDGTMSSIMLTPESRELFKLSAELHDLGKLYTPRSILESGVPVPGVRYELSQEETAIMERHAQDVYDVFNIPGIPLLKTIRDITGAHHVFANGQGGYPASVREALSHTGGVPFEAKILTVSDVFEALTAEREYREGIGLPLSTTLNIMNSMASKGQIDPQIFRFCVESGVFEEYAASKKHVSQYDPELLEKLGYSKNDLVEAAQVKKAISEDAGIPMDKLEGLLKLSLKKLQDMADEGTRLQRETGNDQLLTHDKLTKLVEHRYLYMQLLRRDRTVDEAYADKLLAMSAAEAGRLEATKLEIANRVYAGHASDEAAVRHMEDAVTAHVSSQRGLHMGVPQLAFDKDFNPEMDMIKNVLRYKETRDIAAVKARILSSIPSEPLSGSERLTLFQPARYKGKTAALPDRV